MTTDANVLAIACSMAFALAAGAATWALAPLGVAARPTVGPRGLARKRALEHGAGFRAIEPAMRLLAQWIATLPIATLRADIDARIVRAGEHLGLDANETLALCVIGSAGGGAMGWVLHDTGGSGLVAALMFAGAAAPFVALRDRTRQRVRQISRELPTAIDLAALCMGAGADFAAALRMVAGDDEDGPDALRVELRRILQELALGHTRREAVMGFAQRVPSPEVRDFANAVVQADAKGNALNATLEVQARVLRARRSVAAEEAAARASVLLAFPLLLLLACILSVMLGPFFVTGLGLE
jgi:tight adherence protein C